MVFKPEQLNYVLELYELTGNSPSRATELFKERYHLSIDTATIRKKWKNAGYARNTHGGKRSGLNDGEIRQLYNKYSGDITEMMKDIGRDNPATLVKRCHELNLNIHNIPIKNRKRNEDYFPKYIV